MRSTLGRQITLIVFAILMTASILFPPYEIAFTHVFGSNDQPPDDNPDVYHAVVWAPLFSPPDGHLSISTDPISKKVYYDNVTVTSAKVDLIRLLLEWVGILALSAAAWGVLRQHRLCNTSAKGTPGPQLDERRHLQESKE